MVSNFCGLENRLSAAWVPVMVEKAAEEIEAAFADPAASFFVQAHGFIPALFLKALHVPFRGARVEAAIHALRVRFIAGEMAVEAVILGPFARNGVLLLGPAIELGVRIKMSPAAIEPFEVADRENTVADHAPLTLGATAGIEADRKLTRTGGMFVQNRLPAAAANAETSVVDCAAADALPPIVGGKNGVDACFHRRCEVHLGITNSAAIPAHVIHFAVFVQMVEGMRGRLEHVFAACFISGRQKRSRGAKPALGYFAKLFADDLEFHANGTCEQQSHNRYCILNSAIFSRLRQESIENGQEVENTRQSQSKHRGREGENEMGRSLKLPALDHPPRPVVVPSRQKKAQNARCRKRHP
jgi:hypothetical protein